MSEAAAQEPTMEEILASIRRIISEDETPAPAAAEAAEEPEALAAPEPVAPPAVEPAPPPPPVAAPPPPVATAPPPPAPAPAPAPAPHEDVLELTQRVEPPPPAPAPHSLGDLDFEDVPAPPAPAPRVESLVSDHAASAAASHFGALGQALLMPAAGRTLEDVVKELMKPMLKAWLDEHLPGITEAAVRAEVERISRRGG